MHGLANLCKGLYGKCFRLCEQKAVTEYYEATTKLLLMKSKIQ